MSWAAKPAPNWTLVETAIRCRCGERFPVAPRAHLASDSITGLCNGPYDQVSTYVDTRTEAELERAKPLTGGRR